MNAAYNARQHRLFTNALSCLSRFGDKLSLRCSQPEDSAYAIRLSSINPAGSAFCAFCFFPDFFESYELESDRRRVDLLLSIRTLQNVLKSQLNRKLDSCEFALIENDAESRLAIRLHSFHGVTKTFKLTFEEQRSLFPASPQEGSKVVMDPKTVQSLLDHFGSRSNGEISLVCSQDSLTIKSRNDDFIDKNARIGKAVWTEVRVDSRFFKVYKIEEEVELTFSMREFKAAIALADHLALPLELSFSLGGAPLIVKVRCQTMVAEIFIATSPPSEDQVRQKSPSARDASRPHRQDARQEEDRGERVIVEQVPAVEREERAANRDESEIVQSGRSAQYHNGPLQSTAPVRPTNALARQGHGLPSQSEDTLPFPSQQQLFSQTREDDTPLFFGPASSQSVKGDHDAEGEGEDGEMFDSEMNKVMDEAEAAHVEASQRQAETRTEDLLTEMLMDTPSTEPTRPWSPSIVREEEELAATDDEEELPSTQRESNKRARYESLFSDSETIT